jgi:hypothetical protein
MQLPVPAPCFYLQALPPVFRSVPEVLLLRKAGTLRPYPLMSLSGLGGAAVRSSSDYGEVSHLLQQGQGLGVRVQRLLGLDGRPLVSRT